jgi:hypothetical protein
LEGSALDVIDHLCLDDAAALDHADDRSLVCRAAARVALAGNVSAALVQVPGLAADVSLVHFNFARQQLEAARAHRKPDAMEHEPRRLLRCPERPSEFVRANPVLRVGSKPDSGKPLVQTERRILKDRADLDRVLLLTRLALPEVASGQVGVLRAAALRADRPVRPAQASDEIGADIEV